MAALSHLALRRMVDLAVQNLALNKAVFNSVGDP